MQKYASIIGAMVILVLSTLAAHSATLTNISGDVRVNKGNGYQVVRKPITLNPGDQVLVGQNSTASIAYPNGVSLPVNPGQVTSITSAVGSAGVVGGLTTTTLVVGGAVVVGGIAAAVTLANRNDSPASP